MKIKDIENRMQEHIEKLREIRDELTKLHDDVADSEIDGKQIFANKLKWASNNIMDAANSLESASEDYSDYEKHKEEREAMEKFTSFRPW